ncbi:MAG: hemerythrin family protein [Oscillospiraceae bacterium]|nr:hemerythrin family protein [Oscillospiraceae bacterium]
MSLAFTKDLEVGVKKVDDQHKELIERINAVTAMGVKSATKEETQKTIDLLNEYVTKHFRDEEALQAATPGYPKMAEHKALHKAYLAEIQKLKQEFQKNGPSAAFTVAMSNSIIGWIVRHIKTVDVEFGKYYNAK